MDFTKTKLKIEQLFPLIQIIEIGNDYFLYDGKTSLLTMVSLGQLKQILSFHSDIDLAKSNFDPKIKQLCLEGLFIPLGLDRITPSITELKDILQLQIDANLPRSLIIEITESCNLSCRYCYFASNIGVSDERPNMERVRYATEIANIDDFIETLPLGYNTKIGADGHGLSTGQKQRLLIARAAYKNAKFLFFDEATNSLDANNERTIMERLERLFDNKTVVIVAHRLSTVKHADNIIVLDEGRVVEQGNHAALIAQQGYYYNLIKNQLELGN